MYKVASDKRQTALHRGRPADWVNGEERLPPEEQLRLMVDGIRIIDSRISEAPDQAEKQKLGKEKLAMQNSITAFRAKHGLLRKRNETGGLAHLFVDIAKAMLPKVQFEMIWNATLREYSQGTMRLTSCQQEMLKDEAKK